MTPRNLALPAAAVALGAFLLFLVQPLLAKRILPWFGGSAAIWTACMLFFQVMLLVGYLYAHLLQKLPGKRQALVHLALLGASLLTLPLNPNPAWKPGITGDPTFRILGLLLATVGLPYLLLSSTSPLVQAWMARERPGWQPYRLFSLSNAGSLLALLVYPVLVEPFLPLGQQAWLWTAGFLLYVFLASAMALRSRRAPDPAAEPSRGDSPGAAPPAGMRLLWVALAFSPSLLLLAVTSHLSTNVAPIPFLWVLPLCLYLLSFILCFDHPRWYLRRTYLALAVPALLGMAWLMIPDHPEVPFWLHLPERISAWVENAPHIHAPVRIQVLVFSASLFAACMACHGELARLRPAPRHLTAFYLSLSSGGALGGFFAGIVAPRIFSTLVELPLALVATALLLLAAWVRDGGSARPLARRTRVAALGLCAFLLVAMALWQRRELAEDSRLEARNFYGALRVVERGEGRERMRLLLHGTINHGGQYVAGDRALAPTTYYGADSGIGIALRLLQDKGPVAFGVVGLGSGTLADYARPGDRVRIYEINPLVRDIAKGWFQALPACRGTAEVAMGDARLSMERETPQGYDLLAVDAFSSDSIPVHLLTREAFQQYRRQLKPGGIVAVHISNRYLDLRPVLLAEAREGGWKALEATNDTDDDTGVYSSDWVLLSEDGGLFRQPPLAEAGQALESKRTVPRWTDDFSNLYRILK